jgi:hypothetical protein
MPALHFKEDIAFETYYLDLQRCVDQQINPHNNKSI